MRAYKHNLLHTDITLSDSPQPDPLPRAFLKLIQKVFKGTLNAGEIDEDTTSLMAQNFMKAVYEGYGGDFKTFAYDTPDYAKLAHLEKNVYQFAGAKNYHMLRDLTAAIKDGDKVLTYKEWSEKAKKIMGNTYEGKWKKIEYNTAITGGQMASKAVLFDKHPDALIEYRATEDQHECPICRPFNGIIRPWNDPFWKKATPPNHFGCRCNTIRLNNGTPTPEKEMPNFETIPKMFRTNLAHDSLVFPDDSPYYIACPKPILEQALSLRSYDRRFETIHEHKSGGHVIRHIEVDTNHIRYRAHEDIAIEKAAKGHKVEILPEVFNKEHRQLMLPDAKGSKNPDLKIDGQLVEVKNPESSKNSALRNNIKKAGNQADHIIINAPNLVKMDKSVEKLLNQKFKDKPSLKTIEFRHKGHYQVFKREDYI